MTVERVWVKDLGFGSVVPGGDPNYTFVDLDDGQKIAIRNGDTKRPFVSFGEGWYSPEEVSNSMWPLISNRS